MIIVYSSKSGSTKSYAEALASRLGCGCVSVRDEIPAEETIVFLGWIRGDEIVGLRGIDRKRVKAVCVVGLDDFGRFESNKPKILDKNSLSVPVFYLRGWIDRSKLNIVDKTVLLAVSVMMKLQGLNQYNQPIFDAMMKGGSFYDESQLDAVERFCNPPVA